MELDEILYDVGYGPCGVYGCNKVRELNSNVTDKTTVYWPCDNCTSNPDRYSAPDLMTKFNKEIFGALATLLITPYNKR